MIAYKEYQDNERQRLHEKIYTWKTDLYQSSLEDNNVTVDLFNNYGEGLPRFKIPSKTCNVNDEYKSVDVLVNNKKYNYEYFCLTVPSAVKESVPRKALVYVGNGLAAVALTGNHFSVAEKYGEDVKVKISDKVYTFDAAGYDFAYKEMGKYYRSK